MNIQQLAPDSAARAAVWQLREAVLRQPLGLSLQEEDLSGEKDDVFFAAYEDAALVGCLLLRLLPNGKAKLRQMAVVPARQRTGIGGELLRAAEACALEKGALFLELHARTAAVDFYRNHGFHPTGEPFTEVGIPHQKMEKPLTQ